MFDGIGAAVLGFLAQHAAAGALDRVAGERIDALCANRRKRNAFDRSVALALAQVERDHPVPARILADRTFCSVAKLGAHGVRVRLRVDFDPASSRRQFERDSDERAAHHQHGG